MSKAQCASTKNARVYSFIPCDQPPKDAPHKYDAFLEPLVNDLTDLYIDGKEVFFKLDIDGYSPPSDSAPLRVVPLLLTADLKAHAEVSLSSAGGLHGCRRCDVGGEYIPARSHYYYGNFQYCIRYPSVNRTVDSNRVRVKEVDSAVTVTERQHLAKKHGVRGESTLQRLNDLCRFDPVKDLVVDVMHSVVLNLIRSALRA